MKRSLLIVTVALLVVAGAGWWWRESKIWEAAPAGPHVMASAATSSTSARTATEPALLTTTDKARGSPLAAKLNAPGSDAQQDVETLLELLRQYLRPLHQRRGPPIGDDIDLVRVLLGRNPLKLVVLPANHPAISPDGHLRDRWGTPYFIHPRGYGEFEIRSAGPDRKLFTADDAVANPGRR